MSICPLNMKNNFTPLAALILAKTGVLSGTRQHHELIAIFQGMNASDMEHTAFLSSIGISISPLNAGHNFGPYRTLIFVLEGVPGHADQLFWKKIQTMF